jgi:3-hydroxyisobutyrate dehydrogenase
MRVGFIGLGNMGGPMAANLVKARHDVTGFDVVPAAADRFTAAGGKRAAGIAAAVKDAEVVITMLPAGKEVRDVYQNAGGVFAAAPKGALLIDSSTIDVATAHENAAAASARGFEMLDAPVSGGVAGAAAATLTFMVGGSAAGFARAQEPLKGMGKTLIHAGPAGNGQAAKICNNLILGISMIAVSESFALADQLGLARQTLYDIATKSSGSCWSLIHNCPAPGPGPNAASNRDYTPGFTTAMMLKDMQLAQDAARAARVPSPLGAEATAIYQLLANAGYASKDFSVVFRFLAAGEEGAARKS